MGLHHSPKVVMDGLVVYLDPANPKSYPGSGSSWNDMTGNGNSGALFNTPTFSSNNQGCFIFNGSNTYVSLPSNQNTKLSNSIQTVSVLANITTIGANAFADLYGAYGSGYVLIKWEPTAVGLGLGGYFYNNRISVTNNYNEWMEITCIIDWGSYNFYLYKNGKFINSTAITPNPYSYGGTSIKIGSNGATGNASDYLNGSIGPIKVYNRALSASEIQQNFNATRKRFGI